MKNATTAAQVLLAYARKDARPTYDELCQRLGLASKQAVFHHVQSLEGKGLMTRSGRKVFLTVAGETAVELINATCGGESLWRQAVRRFFGRYTHAASAAIHAEVDRMDAEFALNWEGMHITRVTKRGKKAMLLRKQSWKEVLRAMRRHSRWCDAAEALGIKQAALQKRVKVLMEKVRESLEVNAAPEEAL